MSTVTELLQRAERLQQHVESLRDEVVQLRNDLARLSPAPTNGHETTKAGVDCLAVALSLAQDLGPEFSSENSHKLAGRGDGWFDEK